MSFFVKAAVHALKKYPVLECLGRRHRYHLPRLFRHRVAVGSPRGLVVPIIRNADQLSLAEIEKQIADYGKRAQEGKLGIEELDRWYLHISNGGTFGSMMSTPIINPPQAAILGMHAAKETCRGRKRPGGGAADDVSGTVLRPPYHRRPRSGVEPGGDQGCAGRPSRLLLTCNSVTRSEVTVGWVSRRA